MQGAAAEFCIEKSMVFVDVEQGYNPMPWLILVVFVALVEVIKLRS